MPMGSGRPAARTQQKFTRRDHLAKIHCRHLWKEYVKTVEASTAAKVGTLFYYSQQLRERFTQCNTPRK